MNTINAYPFTVNAALRLANKIVRDGQHAARRYTDADLGRARQVLQTQVLAWQAKHMHHEAFKVRSYARVFTGELDRRIDYAVLRNG